MIVGYESLSPPKRYGSSGSSYDEDTSPQSGKKRSTQPQPQPQTQPQPQGPGGNYNPPGGDNNPQQQQPRSSPRKENANKRDFFFDDYCFKGEAM